MKTDQIIGDKYRIIDVLGHGGTSVVYLAENIVINNFWAIKTLSKSSPWFSSEMQEITILKGLSHPMLPRVVDLLEDTTSCYIVMDYITGTNLLDHINLNGRVSEEKLLVWAKDLLEVLAYLHDKNPPIIYRDMKPANLMLDDDGRIRLVDFGTARLHRDEATEDTVYIGTQGYAAPEQYGSGRSDPRTDLFNLGMTMVHLATGIHPLSLGKIPAKTALKQSGVSARLIRFIMELIQVDPDKRPQDSGDAINKLEEITNGKRVFTKKSRKVFEGGLKSVIAISSVIPNSGVTSFCLMLGSFLKKQGFRTALMELNPSGDFTRLREALDQLGSLKCKSESHFEAEGLTFYPEVFESSQISRKGMDIIILDLGQLKNERELRELNHADIRVILCPSAIWKFPRILEFQECFIPHNHEEWIYAVLSSQRQEEQILKKQYQLDPVVTFPVPLNPFSCSKEDERRIGSTLEHIFHLSGQKVSFK